jgi:hypothetical protein
MIDLTPNEERALMEYMAQSGMNFRNYDSNRSPLSFDAGMALNYNADMARNYGGDDDNRAALDLAKRVSKNMSKFRFRVTYARGVGPGAGQPVNITLFRTAFNTGTFSSGDQQFTNATGDVVTISRMSTRAPSIQQFYQLLITGSLGISWARVTCRDFAQLQNPMTILYDTQFTSGTYNEITPDDWYRPTYYDKLTVEMALGITGSQMEGFDWTINATETTPGTILVFNVASAIDIAKLHHGDAPVRKLGPQDTFFQVNSPVGTPAAMAIQNLMDARSAMQKIQRVSANPMQSIHTIGQPR